jgi:hypothetical protein
MPITSNSAAAAGLRQFLAGDAGALGEEGQFARSSRGRSDSSRFTVDRRCWVFRALAVRSFSSARIAAITSASSVSRWSLKRWPPGSARPAVFRLALDVAQRHRQQAAFLQFDDAEIAGELGQRRQRAGAEGQAGSLLPLLNVRPASSFQSGR